MFDGLPQKYDVLSMESFAAWLERQPRRGRYSYCITERCVLTQWLNSLGIYPQRSRDYPPPVDPYEGPFSVVAIRDPQTFGSALSRAKALLSSQSR